VNASGGHNPALAAQLLDDCGWLVGADGVRVKAGVRLEFPCVCQDDTVHRRIAEGVRAQLASLGVRLVLQFEKPFVDFYDAVERGPVSFINKWLWQDPIDALIGFCATRGQPSPNWQFASVPQLDDAFNNWLHSVTHVEMRHAAFEVQRITAEQLPYIPLLTPNDVWVHANHVHNWQPYPANLYPFYHHTWLET
jgi:peptide/nickel transport system substrate-binding protein